MVEMVTTLSTLKKQLLCIGVGTGGARGGPAPPPPPNVGAIKGILTVKLDFYRYFCNNFLRSSTNFNLKNFYGDLHM